MIENLAGLTIATQIVLQFSVRVEPLQARLPTPWEVSPIPSGGSKGANIAVTFNDALLNQDAAGNPAVDAVDRYVGFAIPARHPQTEEEAGFNFRILTAHPRAVPGRYKTSRLGSVLRESYAKGSDMSATVTEHFRFRDPSGGSVELQLQYRRGLPVRVMSQGNVRSSTDPGILRIYKVHELLEAVRSVPQNVDRVMSYQFRVTIAEFSDIFDGSERLISITVVPWYVRQVYNPPGG